jgi:hypothetical protein
MGWLQRWQKKRRQKQRQRHKRKTARIEGRRDVRIQRNKTGRYSAEAVAARQETIREGLSAGGAIAGAIGENMGGGLGNVLSAAGDALSGDDGGGYEMEPIDDKPPLVPIAIGVGVLLDFILLVVMLTKK